MTQDRFGFGTPVPEGNTNTPSEEYKLAEADKERYNAFDKRRFLGEELGLASRFVPKDISDKEVEDWKKAQIYPQSVLDNINTWGKAGMDKGNPEGFLQDVLMNNSYAEDEWKFE